MSLALTALRLGAIATLCADPVIAARCPNRVFDSRIASLDEHEPVPVILVTTEELAGEAYSANNGGVPFKDHCNLVLEIAMNAVADDDDQVSIWVPATDAEMEAILDLLEHRAEEALTIGLTPAATIFRNAVTRRVTRRTSSRFSTDQTGEKLAIRLLTLRVEMKSWQPDDPREPPSGPFASLPEPLRSVARSLPSGSAGWKTCQAIANSIAQPDFDAFKAAELTIAPRPAIDPESPPTQPAPDELGPSFGNFTVQATPDSL